MIKYTHEEAVALFHKVYPVDFKLWHGYDKGTPIEIIFRGIRAACPYTSDKAWENELGPVFEKLVFETPLEEIPLMINETDLLQKIVTWRLEIAK